MNPTQFIHTNVKNELVKQGYDATVALLQLLDIKRF